MLNTLQKVVFLFGISGAVCSSQSTPTHKSKTKTPPRVEKTRIVKNAVFVGKTKRFSIAKSLPFHPYSPPLIPGQLIAWIDDKAISLQLAHELLSKDCEQMTLRRFKTCPHRKGKPDLDCVIRCLHKLNKDYRAKDFLYAFVRHSGRKRFPIYPDSALLTKTAPLLLSLQQRVKSIIKRVPKPKGKLHEMLSSGIGDPPPRKTRVPKPMSLVLLRAKYVDLGLHKKKKGHSNKPSKAHFQKHLQQGRFWYKKAKAVQQLSKSKRFENLKAPLLQYRSLIVSYFRATYTKATVTQKNQAFLRLVSRLEKNKSVSRKRVKEHLKLLREILRDKAETAFSQARNSDPKSLAPILWSMRAETMLRGYGMSEYNVKSALGLALDLDRSQTAQKILMDFLQDRLAEYRITRANRTKQAAVIHSALRELISQKVRSDNRYLSYLRRINYRDIPLEPAKVKRHILSLQLAGKALQKIQQGRFSWLAKYYFDHAKKLQSKGFYNWSSSFMYSGDKLPQKPGK